MLEAMVKHQPELFSFGASAYGSPCDLPFGPYTISSQEGILTGCTTRPIAILFNY